MRELDREREGERKKMGVWVLGSGSTAQKGIQMLDKCDVFLMAYA